MKSKSYLNRTKSGCSITIDASPGASKTEIVGVNPWRGALQVKIAAAPKDGAANEELVRFLSALLSIPKNAVRILKGERSTRKIVSVPIDVEKVDSLLRGE